MDTRTVASKRRSCSAMIAAWFWLAMAGIAVADEPALSWRGEPSRAGGAVGVFATAPVAEPAVYRLGVVGEGVVPAAAPGQGYRDPWVTAMTTPAPAESIPPSGMFTQGPPQGSYIDLDAGSTGRPLEPWFDDDSWDWQFLPSSIIYKAYLAGEKESRFASQHMYNRRDGWLWEPTLGARVGIFRFGNHDPVVPQGWQLDVEGSAQARLVIPENVDVRSVDFRAGILMTRGVGPWRTKFGYYHLSSHLGDEFLLDNPTYPRLNYARDALILGQAFYVTSALRLYGEVVWAFYTDVSEPWEFQFGVDYAPAAPTGVHGAPFFGVNGHVRQELDFGGNITVQAGWAWRSIEAGRLLRFGVAYYNGKSSQYSFYNMSDEMIGMGVWYDF